MVQDPSFAALMERLRGGDPEAARRIFRRFARRLIALAHERLGARLRRKVDAEDIVQSVFKSFFARCGDGQFDVASWDSLWALLAVIALRKCGYRTRHYRAACRDVAREQTPPADEESAARWQAIAREPTPDEAAELTEAVEQLLNSLRDRERRIVELSLQGVSVPEICSQLGTAERTAYRVLERVRAKLERLGDEDK
jgi:RNA polymerase sigma-70 factor (ECF subfamily)